MAALTDRRLRSQFRSAQMAALLLAYVAVGLYLNLDRHTNLVYTHAAYVPIVLASVWWGRKGFWVAAVLGGFVLSFHLFGLAQGSLLNDLARVAFFFTVALCIGLLSERAKAAQEALLASEQKHKWLIENSLAGILLHRDGRILYANGRFARMLGYEPGDLVGRAVAELFPQDGTAGYDSLRGERCALGKDGGGVWLDLATSSTAYEGAPAVIVNALDVTERKRAQEKQCELAEIARKQDEQLVHSSRLAALGEMAAGVAHELNQPLTGIRNFARNAVYMLDKGLGGVPEVTDNLRMIAEQVDRASRIIHQMRNLTRRSERQIRPVSINQVLRDSVEFLMPQMRLSGVEVRLDLAEGTPDVLGDRIRLEQVFLNLLTNARHAMAESHQRRLSVRSSLSDDIDCPAVVEIEDTGEGFPEDGVERLFTPFYTTRKGKHGTGLGLPISLAIVKEHGGLIDATGAPGRGATFTVRLPLAPDESAAEGAAPNA